MGLNPYGLKIWVVGQKKKIIININNIKALKQVPNTILDIIENKGQEKLRFQIQSQEKVKSLFKIYSFSLEYNCYISFTKKKKEIIEKYVNK